MQDDDTDFKVDVVDPRFGAIYSSHHFAIDRTDPAFKETTAMKAIIQERQKRKVQQLEEQEAKPTAGKASASDAKASSLQSLVESVCICSCRQ